ncbi:MAG TPA: DinB family protein [Thermoanaerobaculia bacterium]|nr:DinB family protein [Thermoanaerobaculia bacterium]
MSLFPEQQRALEYVRRRGTEAPIDAIRSRVAATYSEIEAIAEGVPAETAQHRPAPSSWSVYEVVDHLVESDRPAIDQLAELLAGRSVEAHIPAGLQSPQPFNTEWPVLLERFREVHRQILALLDSATNGVPLTGTAPVEMVVKCAGPDGALQPVHWIERFDWKAYALLLHAHNREHIGQLQRIVAPRC